MPIKDKYTVKSIDSFQCKEWLLYKHYAKRIPNIEYSFGLFDNKILKGVITFGTPPPNPMIHIFSNEFKYLELNRLCVIDGLCKNSLSFFVSKSLKYIPCPAVIVSYADTKFNHHGYIYQATNFIYTGLSAKRTDWKIKGLEKLHGMTIADMGRGKDNRSEYLKQLYGDDFFLEERSRKHRYFYFLGNRHQIKRMKLLLPYPVEPYPKGNNERYDSSYRPITQSPLF